MQHFAIVQMCVRGDMVSKKKWSKTARQKQKREEHQAQIKEETKAQTKAQTKVPNRDALMRRLQGLLEMRANDAVKLAYLSEQQMDLIDGLDLTGMAEFKRNSNGTVEVKFTDRIKVAEQIFAMLQSADKEQDGAKLEAFFNTLDGEGV